jgi:hypothetical protein
MLYKVSDLQIQMSYIMSAQSISSFSEAKMIRNILISTPTMFPDSRRLRHNLAAGTTAPEKLVYSQVSSTDLLTIRYRTIPFGRSTVEVGVQHVDTTRAMDMAHSHAPIVKTHHTMMDGTIKTDIPTSMRRMPKNGRRKTISWKPLPLRDPIDTDIDKMATITDTIPMEHLHVTLVVSIRAAIRSNVRMKMKNMTAASMKRFVRACVSGERVHKCPDT